MASQFECLKVKSASADVGSYERFVEVLGAEVQDLEAKAGSNFACLSSVLKSLEEKLDGANLGISLSPDSELRVQNRGQYLYAPYAGQFVRLPDWLLLHGDRLRTALAANASAGLMLFGEWCAARHSLGYDRLPDWFLLFDVYDRSQGRFWSAPRRNELAAALGLVSVPLLLEGRFTLPQLKDALLGQHSQFRQGALEGIVIRRESAEWCEARAKLVRPDFTQAIEEHWSRRRIEWNRLGRSHVNLS